MMVFCAACQGTSKIRDLVSFVRTLYVNDNHQDNGTLIQDGKQGTRDENLVIISKDIYDSVCFIKSDSIRVQFFLRND